MYIFEQYAYSFYFNNIINLILIASFKIHEIENTNKISLALYCPGPGVFSKKPMLPSRFDYPIL